MQDYILYLIIAILVGVGTFFILMKSKLGKLKDKINDARTTIKKESETIRKDVEDSKEKADNIEKKATGAKTTVKSTAKDATDKQKELAEDAGFKKKGRK